MANEKRLIDAEAIARKLKNANCAECNVVRKIQCSACWVNDVLELLEGDTVDAVEVVHGEWIHHYYDSGEPIDDRWYCSECHMCNNYRRTWYCPICGAKMDGDGNG